jgi:hypothetical protein
LCSLKKFSKSLKQALFVKIASNRLGKSGAGKGN